jgi:hypothetical protein
MLAARLRGSGQTEVQLGVPAGDVADEVVLRDAGIEAPDGGRM